jgi:4-hydroxybenzoate polyprenyltransferase
MSLIKQLFNFYINASIHVGMAVYAFVKVTEQYFEFPNNFNLNSAIFFGTITGYNFVKYAGVAKLHHRSLTNNLKIIQVFSLLCFLAMCYFALRLSVTIILFAIPFVTLTFLYAVPFLSGFHKSLRQVSYLKVLVVSFVWVGFTVLLPSIAAGGKTGLPLFLLGLQRFLVLIVLILPFDIRDAKYDAISLQTIPKKIGIQKTKRLGLALMVFALLIEYAINAGSVFNNTFTIFFFAVVILLMRSQKEQSKYYSSFWVESLPIIWWCLILGFHNLP